MAALLAAEVRRIASRRLVRLTAALALIGTLLGGAAAFAFSGSLSEEAYQQRVAEAEARVKAQDAQIESCLHAHGVERGEEISDDLARQCFSSEDVGHVDDPRFHRSRLEAILRGVTGALAVIGWGLGASLVGAEFASRGMTTLLTWEPRRGRVFVAKTVAAMLAATVLALAALVLVALAMWPALAAHGAPLRAGDPTLWSLAGTIGRGVALATISAGIGFAIATIGRNTAAALGAGFAYIIVLENIVGTSLAGWRRWLLLGNVIVFVSGQSDSGEVPGRSVAGAGVFLAAVAVASLAVAGGSFRRRDLA
jgi:ABC-type transport system involved in multi-copper enzyme maturation permease subunit